MRRVLGPLTAATLALTACGTSDPNTGSTPPPVSNPSAPVVATTPAADPFAEAYKSDHQAAAWYPSVSSVTVDGKSVVVISTFGKDQGADAVPLCDAARATADRLGTDYVSVTVRSSERGPIAAFNKLRGETACTAV